MGRDIHLHIETRNEDGSWWHWATLDDLDRRYDAWDLMGYDADTRKPLYEMRGIPNDISLGTKVMLQIDDLEYDTHHHSWLFRSELSTVAINLYDDWKELSAIMLAMSALDTREDYTRIVFWFDN